MVEAFYLITSYGENESLLKNLTASELSESESN